MSSRGFAIDATAPAGELCNMSVPPRTTLKVARQGVRGRRYRIDLATAIGRMAGGSDMAGVVARIREEGGAALLELLGIPADRGEPLARLEEACRREIERLNLPRGFGYFVEEPAGGHAGKVPLPAAIGLLAARSGPLYLPGRFEPSLITPQPVTLFFPFFGAQGVPARGREDRR